MTKKDIKKNHLYKDYNNYHKNEGLILITEKYNKSVKIKVIEGDNRLIWSYEGNVSMKIKYLLNDFSIEIIGHKNKYPEYFL